MNDMFDIFEIIGHLGYTAFSFCMSHWNAIGGGVLMLMQGIYLWYKIKRARGR